MSAVGTKVYTAVPEGSIIISRPLHELKNHITHLEIPSLILLMRVIKTCAMAVFRGHFYDTNVVFIRSNTTFIHWLEGTQKTESDGLINSEYQYMLQNGVAFEPTSRDSFKNKINFKELEKLKVLSLDTLITYYKDTLKVPYFSDTPTVWNNNNFKLFYLTA